MAEVTLAAWLLERIAKDESVVTGGHPFPDTLGLNLRRQERAESITSATLGFRCPTCHVDAGETCMAMLPPNHSPKPADELHGTRRALGRAEVQRMLGSAQAWTTARVLSECAAKRTIVKDALKAQSALDAEHSFSSMATPVHAYWMAYRQTLLALAQPYRGEPGWQDEWTVET